MRIEVLIAAIGIALLPQIARAQTDCGIPSDTGDHWPLAAPESVALDRATLCPMAKWVAETQANVHAVVVAKEGKLVFERYFSGLDERWGQAVGEIAFGPEMKHDERSVTKSVIGLLVGIAIDRGFIKGIDEPVLSFFPEYADLRSPERDRITLRHLLTMSAGLEWHELDIPYTSESNSENRMDSAPDRYRFVLEQKVLIPPGQSWNYSSGSTELLGAVLKKATGQNLDELARKLLFEPLGISDVEWHRYPQGDPIAAGGLRLRARDLAKIGQLVLQRGAWNGAQVVPAAWVEAATSPQINDPQSPSYGYQFWLDRQLVQKSEVHWAVGIGLGGQRLFIAPELDLVVVVNAGLYKSDSQGPVPRAILNQYVLKAIEPHS
jgi:CubicO group peptidase (beta-lactamase class C family)